MSGLRAFVIVVAFGLMSFAALADDRLVRVYAPEVLIETGLLKFIGPRFSLKTQVRVELVPDPAQADLVLGDAGRALFHGVGKTWRVSMNRPDHPGAIRFADWLTSDIGRRTVIGYAPDGNTIFAPPKESKRQVAEIERNGSAEVGLVVSRAKCIRCHRVDDENRMSGIGSTPSFAVLRSLPDWEDRFAAFYVLNPHPSFTVIEGVTLPFPEDRPSPIMPLTMTLEEVEAVLAYVATMAAADLGAPLEHQ
ncbi:cytochrome c family protein [Marimonas lutisalis]|uniref:cytochrome c n=1 Tax=Marimonas lutisalis TaxID=2545756 RepID=UPI0010F7AF55|nr:cytochrome c [Marimonas lutisalis]